jgi:tRNA dimethylallyltransferase
MKNIQKEKLIAIIGPTASGKTAIGVRLAKKFNGEIVSADSRQIYRGLDLGTGKDLVEYGDIKYHLIDICDPEEDFTLQNYLELARKAIDDIFSRGKTPIIVGGTGLYVQGLVEGFVLGKSQESSKEEYSREQLNNLTLEQLQNILREIDPEVFELIDRKNPRRLIRAIERATEGIKPSKIKPDFEVLQIVLDVSKEELNKRIDKRVDDRLKVGMLKEVEKLLDSGVDPEWLIKLGLEYRAMTSFLMSDKIPKPEFEFQNYNSFDEMVSDLKIKSHQYAKRQLTWFKRFPEIVWKRDYNKIEKLVLCFLNKKTAM